MELSPDFQLDLAEFVQRHCVLLGSTRTGKSNTAKVLIEELVASASGIPMTIIDRDGEYWPMSEIGAFIRVGKGEHTDIEFDIDHVADLASFSVEHGVSVILSLSGMKRREYLPFVERYIEALWDAVTGRSEKRPYVLFVEEAQEFAGQKEGSDLKEILIEISKRGLKHGLILVTATQRAASIDKDVITQAAFRILHRATYSKDVDVYVDNVPNMSPAEIRAANAGLAKGQAIVVLDDKVQVVQMRRTKVYDAGATPGLNPQAVPALRSVDEKLLDELRSMLKKDAKQPAPDAEKTMMAQRIAELETMVEIKVQALEQAQATIEQQRKDIEALRAAPSRIDVEAIHAGRIVAPVTETAAAVASPTSQPATLHIAEKLSREAAQRKSRMEEQAQRRAQSAFDALLPKIERSLERGWRDGYTFLLLAEHDGKSSSYTLKEINKQVTRNIDRAPKFLVEQGFVKKTGRGPHATYRSVTREELHRRWPLLDADKMFERVLNVVSPSKGMKAA